VSAAHPSKARTSVRRHLFMSTAGVVLLVFGLGGLAIGTELAGAVVASGIVAVDGSVKKVQHPTGGVVGEIHVRDGDRVRAGDVVVRLDETIARANLAMITKSLDELTARKARLEAERDGLADVAFLPSFAARASDPDVAGAILGESRLFRSRHESRDGQRAQLRERVSQLREQIDGTELQSDAKADEIKLIQDELGGVQELWKKNLVPLSRVIALKREETRLRGERGQLIAGVAQAKGRISETELQAMQIEQDLRSEVAKELREVDAKTAELVERKIAADDQLKRVDIRAPLDGVVHQSSVHTIGGVVAPGDQLMLIVPDSDNLSIEARVSPQDIDQLQAGQSTVLRLSALNQRTTPELKGKVSVVASDVVVDQRTGMQYFPVRITFAEGERGRLGGVKIVPGMPIESFIQTGYRSVFSYLTKPLADHVARAFRQD
jgi:membrane fusion protein, type I secretion system